MASQVITKNQMCSPSPGRDHKALAVPSPTAGRYVTRGCPGNTRLPARVFVRRQAPPSGRAQLRRIEAFSAGTIQKSVLRALVQGYNTAGDVDRLVGAPEALGPGL